ncbi:MAG: Asp-tRNA(Asn)/Glu-tRNA(Gln) amidotransferase subunit GatA [Patescibacteria group bacterium]
MDLTAFTIQRIGRGLCKKEFSVSELVAAYRQCIGEQNPTINAYLEVFDDARDHAALRDRELAEKLENNERIPPLFGVPIAIKDNILIRGKTASAGSRMLAPYTASYDAGVIRKLKEQGAIFLGRTNMDEFAMGSSTEYSAFGPAKNPRDASRVPGGSSGGSAAAVAAGMAPAALGSDTGGSIRQPAALCGVTGLKPTYGRVSRSGLIAMASSLDQIGPLAQTAGDARILFDAIAGRDEYDATSYDITEREAGSGKREVKDFIIGVPKEYFEQGLDPDIEQTVRNAIQMYEDAGAHIEEVTLPHAEYALSAYYIVVPAEVSANLARFDGIRYGYRAAQPENLLDAYEKSRSEGFGPEVKRRLMLGTHILSAGYYDAYYLTAQKVRRLIARDFDEAFARVDLLMGPTTPTPAFRFGEKSDPVSMYLADMYTVAVNLAGIPALSIPAGYVRRDNATLPVGLHLIGPRNSEDLILDAGEWLEERVKNH